MMKKWSVLSWLKLYFPAAALTVLAFITMMIFVPSPARAEDHLRERHKQVLELKPVGYWPSGEGRGKVLHDRSGNENHGKAHFLSWQDGLLDFENDVYQWIQIPYLSAYQSRAFSMGGWVFIQKEYTKDEGKFGAILMGQPFKPKKDKYKWEALWGDRVKGTGVMLRLGPPSSGSGVLVEVVSGGQKDALGSVESEVSVPTHEWQHLMYTYDGSGTGTLYRNSRAVHSSDDVSYQRDETPFVIGGGRWGTHNLGGNLSLDGSVRDMVLFDRTLSPGEVKQLVANSKPDRVPPETDDSDEDSEATSFSTNELMERAQDTELENEARAEAVLALAGRGEEASDAVPVLVQELEHMLDQDGSYPPRVEDFLRNAVMRALLDLAPEDQNVRDLLGKALAKPLLKTLDMSKPYLDHVRPLAQQGQYMDALDALRNHLQNVPKPPKLGGGGFGSRHTDKSLAELHDALPLRGEYFDAYISMGNPYRNADYDAYSPTLSHEGSTYVAMVESVPWEEVKKEYNEHLDHLTDEEPDPEGKWSRLVIRKYAADGSVRNIKFGGSSLIFDISDAKMAGWSLAMDRQGYIHMFGGQHNQPNRDYWIPGSWEKFGIKNPEIMYWVSSKPGDIGSFEIAGQSGSTRHPGGWMNYMQLVRSPDGTLFLYGRGNQWSWALQRYDASKQRWTELKGSVSDMMNRARQKNPEWYNNLGATVPYYGPGDGLVSAWQPGAYNFCRAWPRWYRPIRGVEFDQTGRMHVVMAVLGVGEAGRMTQGPVYAYSDDLGETFHRADGTRLRLPLTVNPIPGHHAAMDHHGTRKRLDLWLSLIQEAGWKMEKGFDRE